MAGAKPGERRGGRQKGTPNKAKVTAERALNEAMKLLPAAEVDAMKPKDFLNRAWQELVKAGFAMTAIPIADKAAAFFDPKFGPAPPPTTLTPEEIRRVADIARAEAARRGINLSDAPEPAAGTRPN